VALIPTILLIFIKKFIIINAFSLIMLGLFFLLSYTLLIFLTGCLDKNDFVVLKSFKRKLLKSKENT
jgi:hypothetical protein